MDAEVAPVPEMTQRLIWDPAQADLQGRAIVDDRGNIACHTLCHLADLRMNILRNRRIDRHERIELVDVNETFAMGARHRWIDVRAHSTVNAENRRRDMYGHNEAKKATGVRGGNLKENDNERQ